MKIPVLCLIGILLSWKETKARKTEANILSERPNPWPLNPNLQRATLNGMSNPPKVSKDFARLSWQSFQKSVENNERRERKQKKSRKKILRQLLRAGTIQDKGFMGPIGPRGPAGPRGPKGANITKAEMFEEFRNLIGELAQKKMLLGSNSKCTELCVSELVNTTGPAIQTHLFDHDILVPKIVSAFMWETMEDIEIPKNTRIELDIFTNSNRTGAKERDVGSSKAFTGRFVAPRTGFYHFSARIHIQLPVRKNGVVMPIPTSQLFSVALCIDGSCFDKMMLETISGFGPGVRMTVSTSGMLYLKVDEYVSVFVDNPTLYPLSIFDGSRFTGYLMGV